MRAAAVAEVAQLRERITAVGLWAMTMHGGTKAPIDIWPGLAEPLGIGAGDTGQENDRG